MFTPSITNACLFDRVGIRNSADPGITELTTAVTTSESLKWVNDVHALLSTENIINCAPKFEDYTYPAFAVGTTYKKYARVLEASVIYESLANANIGNTPPDATWWRVVVPFEEWLIEQRRASINRALNAVYMKNLKEYGKTLLENLRVYEGNASSANKVTNNSYFVGFEIALHKNYDLQVQIERIGFQFDSVQTALPIYLYNSSRKAYVATTNITTTAANTIHWEALTTWIMKYVSDDDDAGASWFVGYFQDDITGQALYKDVDFQKPCSGCGQRAVNNFHQYNKYMKITPIRVALADQDGTNMWDYDNTEGVEGTNYGLNFELTVKCVLDEFICQQKSRFDEIIYLQHGIDLLKMIADNVEDNQQALKLAAKANDIIFAIEGDPRNRIDGLMAQYNRVLENTRLDFGNLDKACMPCSKKSVRYRAK